MANLVENIATYLASQGFGTRGTDLFLQTMPSSPATCTVVFATGGNEYRGNPTRFPSFSIQYRNKNAASGYTTVMSINAALHEKWNVLATYPGRIAATSEPGYYFRDNANLAVFPLNYVLITTKQLYQ